MACKSIQESCQHIFSDCFRLIFSVQMTKTKFNDLHINSQVTSPFHKIVKACLEKRKVDMHVQIKCEVYKVCAFIMQYTLGELTSFAALLA